MTRTTHTLRAVLAAIRALRETDAKPSVHIERTVSGAITYGVRVSRGTLATARQDAEVHFRALAAFAVDEEAKTLRRKLAKSVTATKDEAK